MSAEQHSPEAEDARGPTDDTVGDESSSWRLMHRRQFLRAFTPGVIAILGINSTDDDDDGGGGSIGPTD